MRGLAVAVGVSVILSGAVACTGGEDGPKTKGSSSAAAAQSPAARLGKVTLPQQPRPLVDLIARQVKAARTAHAEIVITSADSARQVQEKTTAQFRSDTAQPTVQMVMVDSTDSSTTEAVVSGGVIYTRVQGQEQEPGKPWVRLSRQDVNKPELGEVGKLMTGLLDSVDQALRDITTDTGLALVRNGSFTEKPVTESLDGVPVTKYAGKTRTAAMPGSDYQALAKAGLPELPWTLWVDEKGLPRRFVVTMATPKGAKAVHTANYTRWGEPVLIQVPPANQVATIDG